MKRLFPLVLLLVVVLGFILYQPLRNSVLAYLLPERPSAGQGEGAAVVNRGIEVRLVEARFYYSKTMLTLQMKHPTISEQYNLMAQFLPLSDGEVKLDRFADTGTSISARGRKMVQGLEQWTYELPPVPKAGAPVVFEIIGLQMRRTEGTMKAPVVEDEYDTVKGPWRFKLTSDELEVDPATVGHPINQQVESSGIQIVLDSVEFSEKMTNTLPGDLIFV